MEIDEAAVRYLLDRLAIEDCVRRYARGIDRHDEGLVLSCYHPDSFDDHGAFGGSREKFFAAANGTHVDGTSAHLHYVTNHSAEIDGDIAHTETYWLMVCAAKDPTVNIFSGRYIDRFERRDGEWRIAARVCLYECGGHAPSMGANLPFISGRWDGADVSYLRPLEVPLRRENDTRVELPAWLGALQQSQ